LPSDRSTSTRHECPLERARFAYLDPIRHLPNLRILPDTLVDKLTLDESRVTGVDVVTSAGRPISRPTG
jgi:choline dehydrogenase-like flavoprotein